MPRSSTTYRPKWKSGATKVIRVPARLAPQLLSYAHRLDAKQQAEELREPTTLYRTAADVTTLEPVNVAAVPHRSPFRYPGGKTWLVPYIRSWLSSKPARPLLLIEPFAGGAIVGLTAAFDGLVEHVLLVECDHHIAAVWQTILSGQANWLAESILRFELTKKNVLNVLHGEPTSQRERAFATILRNRVQRGGIMAAGAGLVKNGENGHGLNSRWYPNTLARRIREITQIRGRFSFLEGDGIEIIQRHAPMENAVFFVDPPYTIAAKRLYQHWQVDHRLLFRLLSEVKGDVLLTYDNTLEIAALAREYSFETQAVAMKNTHHAKMTELLIGKDLSWLRRAASERESHLRTSQEILAFPP